LKVNLTGWIVARGKDGVYLDFNNKEANLREITSTQGTINLTATSFVHDTNIVGAVIGGKDIVLVATSGNIGMSNDYLRINQFDGGMTDLKATGGIYVYGTNVFDFVNLISGGDIIATAYGNLSATTTLTANTAGTAGADVKLTAGGTITLEDLIASVTGSFTVKATKDLIIFGNIEVLTTSGFILDAGNDIAIGIQTETVIENVVDETIVSDDAIIVETVKTVTTNIETTKANVNIEGLGSFKAKNDLLITGSSITTSANFVLEADNIIADIGINSEHVVEDTEIVKNIVEYVNTNLNIGGSFNATAEKELTLQNLLSFTAGSATLTATNGQIDLNNVIAYVSQKLSATAKTDLTINDTNMNISDAAILTALIGDLTLTNGSLTTGGNTTLKTGTDLIVSDTLLNIAGKLTATASNDLILDGMTKVGGNTSLTATTGKADILKALTVDGNLDIVAKTNLTLTGIVTKNGTGTANLTATTGKIIDGNGTVNNITADSATLNLTAALGIGDVDSLELTAKILNAEVTGNGNVSVHALSDLTVGTVIANGSLVDIFANGNLILETKINAKNNIVLGADGNIVFRKYVEVKSVDNIVVLGNLPESSIYSEANDLNGVDSPLVESALITFYAPNLIYGLGTKNKGLGGFVTDFEGVVNMIGSNGIYVYSTSNNDMQYNTLISGGRTSLIDKNGKQMDIKAIVTKEFGLASDLAHIGNINDTFSGTLVNIISDSNILNGVVSPNNSHAATNIYVTLNDIELENTGDIHLDTLTISEGNGYQFAVDSLVLDNIDAGDGASITVVGKGIDKTNYFIVNNIVSQIPNSNFTILGTKADYMFIYSQSNGLNLHVKDSYVGVQANYYVDGVSTFIDAASKNRNGVYSMFDADVANGLPVDVNANIQKYQPYSAQTNRDGYADFRIWTLDGNYSLDMNGFGLAVNDNSLRILSAFNHLLLLNGYFNGTDSAFENSQAEERHSINSTYKIIRLLSTRPQTESNVLNPFQWYYHLLSQPIQNSDENRPIIRPVRNEDDEEEYGNTEENTDSEQAGNTLTVSTLIAN
jgi:hypothetical protein